MGKEVVHMAIAHGRKTSTLLADKQALLRLLEEQDKETGFVPVPNATARKAREMMLADGVRPEDCIFSRGIFEMRE
jgi:hypothetical protein